MDSKKQEFEIKCRFYPFHYGPFASDFKGMGQVRVKFEKGVPFLPFDQLLSILPQRR